MTTISKIIKFVAATTLIGILALAAIACGQESASTQVSEPSETATPDQPTTLPEVEEVAEAVPDLPTAPDFTLPAANKDSTEISLSSFQGDQEVVLVFYRAFW